MINVICVKWGTKYSAADVNRLKRNVERYLTVPHTFHCYTEDPTDLDCNIIYMPLDNDLEIYWNKLAMFQEDFLEGTCLFFDIDVVIQSNINHILDYLCDDLTMIRCYWKGDKVTDGSSPKLKERWDMYVNSSCLLWRGGSLSSIWKHFESNDNYYMIKYKGIDRFLFHEGFNLKYFPPGLVYSRLYGIDETATPNIKYKDTSLFDMPDIPICLFNGPVVDQMYEPLKHHWE